MEVMPELSTKRQVGVQWVNLSGRFGKVGKKCFLSIGKQRYEGLQVRESMVLSRTPNIFLWLTN